MAISLPSGFKIGSIEPIDIRLTLTKAEMYAVNENTMPPHYFAICKDDNKIYVFDKTNEKIATLGKFRLYQAPVDENDLSGKLPGAIVKAMQSPETKAQMETAVGEVVPGAMEKVMDSPEKSKQLFEAMFDTDLFQQNVSQKVSLAISVIEGIDGTVTE